MTKKCQIRRVLKLLLSGSLYEANTPLPGYPCNGILTSTPCNTVTSSKIRWDTEWCLNQKEEWTKTGCSFLFFFFLLNILRQFLLMSDQLSACISCCFKPGVICVIPFTSVNSYLFMTRLPFYPNLWQGFLVQFSSKGLVCYATSRH